MQLSDRVGGQVLGHLGGVLVVLVLVPVPGNRIVADAVVMA